MSEPGAQVVVEGVEKSYEGGRIRALRGVGFAVEPGESVAIMGPSGCGKSTLLNLLGGLDVADAGRVEVGGVLLSGAADLTAYRARTVGFVFQLHNLIPVLTAAENVQVPMLGGTGRPRPDRRARALELLRDVGLEDRADAVPPRLSGGERQRVAVARALAGDPGLVLADEPTGSLDQATGELVLTLLTRLSAEKGTTLVVVTHDAAVAARTGRVISMLDGRITSDGPAGRPAPGPTS